jgi:hypothetical protein
MIAIDDKGGQIDEGRVADIETVIGTNPSYSAVSADNGGNT